MIEKEEPWALCDHWLYAVSLVKSIGRAPGKIGASKWERVTVPVKVKGLSWPANVSETSKWSFWARPVEEARERE